MVYELDESDLVLPDDAEVDHDVRRGRDANGRPGGTQGGRDRFVLRAQNVVAASCLDVDEEERAPAGRFADGQPDDVRAAAQCGDGLIEFQGLGELEGEVPHNRLRVSLALGGAAPEGVGDLVDQSRLGLGVDRTGRRIGGGDGAGGPPSGLERDRDDLSVLPRPLECAPEVGEEAATLPGRDVHGELGGRIGEGGGEEDVGRCGARH